MPEEKKPELQLHPELVRALALTLRGEFPDLERMPESDEEIAALCGTTLEEARAMETRLRPLVLQLDQEIRRERELSVPAAVIEYLGANPGAVRLAETPPFYSDGFQRFVVSLTGPGEPGEGLPLSRMAELAMVPADTLEQWFRDRSA